MVLVGSLDHLVRHQNRTFFWLGPIAVFGQKRQTFYHLLGVNEGTEVKSDLLDILAEAFFIIYGALEHHLDQPMVKNF